MEEKITIDWHNDMVVCRKADGNICTCCLSTRLRTELAKIPHLFGSTEDKYLLRIKTYLEKHGGLYET
jgi:hypothetical protein